VCVQSWLHNYLDGRDLSTGLFKSELSKMVGTVGRRGPYSVALDLLHTWQRYGDVRERVLLDMMIGLCMLN